MSRASAYAILLIYANLLVSDSLLAADRLPVLVASAFTGSSGGVSSTVLPTRITRKNHNTEMASKLDLSSQDKANGGASASPCPPNDGSLQFGKFTIDATQIFYRSPTGYSAAIVNLRPIVPGHVLVIIKRATPLLKDLTDEEYSDLWFTVRRVQNMLECRYFGSNGANDDCDSGDAASFNVAVQDGSSAGQSVPHVHVHILPRKSGDFERNDDVYDELEAWAPREEDSVAKKDKVRQLEVLEDEDRRDRTMEQMKEEADGYRDLMK